MYLKLPAILLLCILQYSLLKAQTTSNALNPTLENIIPASPSASALAKFGSIPVGLSTGIPEVSIPIFNYQGTNNLALQVSLDYHAGGIRVNETASNVGIGWALNAGGVITRTLRGIPDEAPTYGFLNSGTLPASETEGNAPQAVEDRTFNKIYRGELDNQNDIFTFNFNGHSGKFIYGKNNDFLLINQQKLKIEKELSTINNTLVISKFTITDEYGIKYIFKDYELTINYNNVYSGRYCTSAWYLSEIQTPSGKDNILFQYADAYLTTYQVSKGYTQKYNLTYNTYASTATSDISRGYVDMQIKRLKKITLPNKAEISLTYDSKERTDLKGDTLLTKITISDPFSNKRGLNLEQDYSLNRATLTKVIPFGGGTETAEGNYTFTYNSALPDLYSDKQDHWGYYDVNSDSLIPWEISSDGFSNNIYELSGSNRDTDPSSVKAGSLTKITYPTGGYAIFEMEANQAKSNWLDQSFTKTIPGSSSYQDKSASVYVSSSNSYGSSVITVPFEGEANTSTTFTISAPATLV